MLRTVVRLDSRGAWRAPIAGFLTTFLTVGFGYSSGIIALGLHNDYDIPQELLLPTVLLSTGLMLLLSPAIEWLSVCIGSKASMMTSTLLLAFSLILCFFVPITGVSVLLLLGVNYGVGRSFGNFVVHKYTMIAFKRRRGVAASLFTAGAPAGGILLPPLFALLLDHFGVRITLLLAGAILLHQLVAFVLIPSMVVDREGRCLTPIPRWESRQPRTDAKSPAKMVKEPLAVEVPFLLFACIILWIHFSITTLGTYMMPLYAAELHLSNISIAAAFSTRSGVDLCMRLLTGFAFNKVGKRGRLVILVVTLTVGLIGLMPLLFWRHGDARIVLYFHAVCLAIADACIAVGWAQTVAVLSNNFYTGRAIAFVMLLCGATLLGGAIGFGAVRRRVGTYLPVYFCIAGCGSLTFVCYFLAAVILPRCERTEAADEPKCELEALNKVRVEKMQSN